MTTSGKTVTCARCVAEVERSRALLTRPWADLDLGDQVEALAAVRDSASQQVADELDQAARLGVRVWRDPAAIADRRVRDLHTDDPRRWTYRDHLRATRAAYRETS